MFVLFCIYHKKWLRECFEAIYLCMQDIFISLHLVVLLLISGKLSILRDEWKHCIYNLTKFLVTCSLCDMFPQLLLFLIYYIQCYASCIYIPKCGWIGHLIFYNFANILPANGLKWSSPNWEKCPH